MDRRGMLKVSALGLASAMATWGQRCYAAARQVVAAAGGAKQVGPKINKAGSSLAHELDPDYKTAKLGLIDAVRITLLTGDLRILTAFAAECGCMVLPLPDLEMSGACVMAAVARVTKELSDYIAAVSRTMADGQVSGNELEECRAELGQLIAAAQGLHGLMQAKHLEQQPAAVREVVA